MAAHVLTLDALRAAVTEAFRATNASLDSAPSPEAGSSIALLRYRIPHETKYGLRTIPYSAFYSHHRYQLREMAFNLPCYVVTRRSKNASSTVLSLRAPPWWQRMRRRPVGAQIDIHVSADGTTIDFGPCDAARLPRKGNKWILLLTPEQQIALDEQVRQAQDPSHSKHQESVLRRAFRAFARCLTSDRNHHDPINKDS